MTRQTNLHSFLNLPFFTVLLGAASLLVFAVRSSPAQDPVGRAMTVLLRGPVHEALAEQFARGVIPELLTTREPPERLRELPPEHQPEGIRIVWIPGYWAWDDEVEEFLWVSGLWRTAPPNHRWVPGAWVQDTNGYRWVPGFWSPLDQESFSYLPLPPAKVGEGVLPIGRPPSREHFWVPGGWVYSDGAYRWRAGNWARGHDNWVWVPDRYIWSPAGAIYRPGYWDHRLIERGILFAPVRFAEPIYTHRGFTYTPAHTLDLARILPQLFVRPGYSHYYFGDYYDPVHRARGIYPWVRFQRDYRGFDPLYADYWRRAYEEDDFLARVAQWHEYYTVNEALRPPRTLADQRLFADRYAGSPRLLAGALLATGLQELAGRPGRWRFRTLSQPARLATVEAAEPLVDLAERRSEATPEIDPPPLQLPELPPERVEVLRPILEVPDEEQPLERPEVEIPDELPAAEPDEIMPERPTPEKPEPVKPEPVKPEPEKPEPVKPEPVKPEPEKPEPKQPEPEQPEPKQPEPKQPEPKQPEPKQPEPKQPEPKQPEPE